MHFVWLSEGGYVNDPADRGGETKYGITKLTARAYGYNGDMRALVKEEARDIYLKGYYNSLYDKIDSIDIAYKLFDLGINCGTATAVKRIQILCARTVTTQVNWLSKVDGHFGPKTLFNLNERIAKLGDKVVWNEYIALMEDYYKSIVATKPSQSKFIKGWLNRLHKKPIFGKGENNV